MRIEHYVGPVDDAFAHEVARLAGKNPGAVSALDIARALRHSMVTCLWYENGVRKLQAVAVLQCVESITGERTACVSEVYAVPEVPSEHLEELIAALVAQGVRWDAAHISTKCLQVTDAQIQAMCAQAAAATLC